MRFGPLLAAAALVAVPTAASAQPPLKPEDGKLVLRLTADPAPAPTPALKYPLLPELRELNPGNQIPAFYKCFFEQNNFYYAPESVKDREHFLVAPLAELAEAKELIGYGGSGLRQADYAARLDTADWQFTTQLRNDGINALLPDVQQLRMLAQALKVRMRGEVARKDFPAAARSAQTLFALAKSFNHHPTLIGQLVGAAITNMTLDAVEEFVAQPGAPNLFWSLTDLPAPFVDLRAGMQGERAWTEKDFGALRKPDPLSEAELMRMTKELDKIIKLDGGAAAPGRRPDWAEGLAADPAVFAAAKDRLVAAGFPAAAVGKMSRLQVYLTDEYLQYETLRDDLLKWTNVPFWKVPPDVDGRVKGLGGFAALLPAISKVVAARVRIQQRIDLLKVVEAVRLHAAEHGGAVPSSLDAVALPLPPDPVTGKSFGYEVQDGKAVIRGTPPPDRKNEPQFNRVYEVAIRK
ncbi:MAG: hypothetical protein K2X82_32780 [Gemmataceae bacterium]|nr:hypothetical protein [Gemmataceae bacterium]